MCSTSVDKMIESYREQLKTIQNLVGKRAFLCEICIECPSDGNEKVLVKMLLDRYPISFELDSEFDLRELIIDFCNDMEERGIIEDDVFLFRSALN